MRVWLWLVYKFTENYCRLRLLSEFIQTQKRYPTSLDKIRILTWKLIAYHAKIFRVNLTPSEFTPCKIPHICRCALSMQDLLVDTRHYPANIRLDEYVLKKSFLFVFKTRLDEDEYVLINHTSSEVVFNRSSRRLGRDQYIRRSLQDVSQIRLEDIF